MEEREWNYCAKCGKQVDETHLVNERLDDGTEADYYAYCKECGTYLYAFCWGSFEY